MMQVCEEFVVWVLHRGYCRDSPRQQLEDGLQGIAGHQLTGEPAGRVAAQCTSQPEASMHSSEKGATSVQK